MKIRSKGPNTACRRVTQERWTEAKRRRHAATRRAMEKATRRAQR